MSIEILTSLADQTVIGEVTGAIRNELKEELNGEFILTFSIPAIDNILASDETTPLWKTITTDRVLKADGHLFDVVKVQRIRMQGGEKILEVLAEHVSYRLNTYFIAGWLSIDETCEQILAVMLGPTEIGLGTVEVTGTRSIVYNYNPDRTMRQTVYQVIALFEGEVEYTYDGSGNPLLNVRDHRGKEDGEARRVVYSENLAGLREWIDKREEEPEYEIQGQINVAELVEIGFAEADYKLEVGDAILLKDDGVEIDRNERIMVLSKDLFEPVLSKVEIGLPESLPFAFLAGLVDRDDLDDDPDDEGDPDDPGEPGDPDDEGEPAVRTLPASKVLTTTAQLNGEILAIGDYDFVEAFFRWREKKEDPDPITTTSTTAFFNPTGFSTGLTELTAETTYEFQAGILYGGGLFQIGDTHEFTTLAEDPVNFTLITKDARDVGKYDATLVGEVVEMGEYDEVVVSCEYKKQGEDTVTNTATRRVTEEQEFTRSIDELESDTVYEFRAKAIGEGEEGEVGEGDVYYGDVKVFKTKHEPLVYETLDIPSGDITTTTALLRGRIVSLGGLDSTYYRLRYRKKDAGEWIGLSGLSVSEPQTVTEIATSLDPDTWYSYQIIQPIGWPEGHPSLEHPDYPVEGAIKHFKTKAEVEDEPPVILTKAATDITEATATLNAELVSLGFEDSVTGNFDLRAKNGETWDHEGIGSVNLTSPANFNHNVSGLTGDTTYEFRAYVTWNGERKNGAILEFTTIEGPVEVPSECPYSEIDEGPQSLKVSGYNDGLIKASECYNNDPGNNPWDGVIGNRIDVCLWESNEFNSLDSTELAGNATATVRWVSSTPIYPFGPAWYFEISDEAQPIWDGYKTTGDTPLGTYDMDGGCADAPATITIVEA